MSFPTLQPNVSEPCESSDTHQTDLDIATDPETAPVLLSRMANACAGNEPLAEALALNPNTPLPDLFKLWCERPFAALENPITAFHTLCSGRLLHQVLPREVQHQLYVALRSSNRAAELDEHLPVEARLLWLNGPEPDIGWFFRSPGGGVIRHPRDAAEAERIRTENAFALRFFELLGQDPSGEVRKHGIHAVRIRFKLAKDPSVNVRRELIKHLVDQKNEDPLDRKHARPQLRLLLDSATQSEKALFLKNKLLRRLLARWRTESATNPSKPCP